MDKTLSELRTATLECTFCGACQATCPVYAEIGSDPSCSRGRLFQLRNMADGKLPRNAALAKSLTRCTLCMTCAAKCPAGINTTDLFLQFRKLVADDVPLPALKRLAFASLSSKRLFEFLLSSGSLFQGLFLRKAERGPGYFPRLPLAAAGLNKRRLLPALAKRPLRRRAAEKNTPTGKARARVIFFPGCMLHYVYPEAGKSLINVLLANQVEVLMPQELSCCGTPVFTSGDFSTAKILARNNIKTLAAIEADAIVTGCATCGTALMHEYGLVLGDDPAREQWETLKGKVRDFSEFLTSLGPLEPASPISRTVTYHDPCHLVRGMKVAKEPRALIRGLPGVEFKEMADADRCCGCAGTFSAQYYDLAAAINDHKIQKARATGADLLVTGCSACRMHIADGFTRNETPMETLHTAELIAQAYACRELP